MDSPRRTRGVVCGRVHANRAARQLPGGAARNRVHAQHLPPHGPVPDRTEDRRPVLASAHHLALRTLHRAHARNHWRPGQEAELLVKNAFCFETHFGLGLEKILQTYKTSNSISVFCVSLNIYTYTKQFIHAPVVSLLRSSRLSAVELILSSPLAVINPTTIKSRGCTPSPRISRLIL